MYQKTVLDNGLTVATERIPEFRSCSLGLWVGAGSRFETEEQAGLSHFLEHMLFKGTSQRTAYDIAVAMDGVGGQLNAFTEREHTCYYARVMDRHLPLALDVLSDMYTGSRLEQKDIDIEKTVILEEIKMYEDTPDDQIFDIFTRSLYSGHPLGRPIIGYAKVVESVKRGDFTNYMEARYRSSNLLVAAAGQVDHDELVAAVQQHICQKMPESDPLKQCLVAPKPSQTKAVYNKDCEQAHICYGCSGLAYTDKRRYGLLLLDSVLGGSMSSRLFQEIREKQGLVYSVSTFQNSYFDGGLFGVYAGTSAEKVEQVLELTRTIFASVRSEGIDKAELERAREHLKGSLALGMESTSNRMMRLARTELYHKRFIPLSEVIDEVDAVTMDDIRELTDWLLDPDRYTLSVLGPVEQVDGVRARPLSEPAGVRPRAARS